MKLTIDALSILEAAPDSVIIINQQGTIVYVNALTETLFDYSREELLGNTVEKLMPERYRERHIAHRTSYFANPRVRPMGAELELYGQKKNGAEFPIEISLSPLETDTGMVTLGAVRDITLRKKAEAKFKAILEAMPDALVIVNHEGKIVLANAQAEQLFQYSRSELLSMTLEQLIPERFRIKHQLHRNAFFNNPRIRPIGLGLELYGLKKDRSEIPVEISLSPLESEEGLWVLAAVRDATERKTFEQALQEKNRALQRHHERQEEFTSTICHEIRNPLNVIYGETDILSQKLNALELAYKSESCQSTSPSHQNILALLTSCREDLDIVKECSQQQKVIVDDVLDFSKLESDKVELNPMPFSVQKMIQTIVLMFNPQIKQKNLSLQLDMPEEEIWLKADIYRLRQILINLLSNAVKFTPTGAIRISFSVQPSSTTESTLSISVKDTGIGMTPEESSRLFTRFSQANPQVAAQYGGTGLGLMICKRLVEKMGGNIYVESQKWQGSEFSFTVKCNFLTPEEQLQLNGKASAKGYSQSNNLPVEQANVTSLSHSENKNILIVEDNKINQKILENYLKQRGCFWQIANNGLEAIQLFENSQFDLILMDMEMPVMGGLEATEQIRAKEKNLGRVTTPIIGLSGNAQDKQIAAAQSSGMNAYLTKPFHKEQLYDLIDEYTTSSSPLYKKENSLLSPQLKANLLVQDTALSSSLKPISLDTEQSPANDEQQSNNDTAMSRQSQLGM